MSAHALFASRLQVSMVMEAQTRTVVLIGTSHKYQRPNNPMDREFRTLINQRIGSNKISAIAEEMSLEALSQQDSAASICNEIAKSVTLTHVYCDPNNEWRQKLGIRGVNDIKLEGFYSDWADSQIDEAVAASHAIRE